MKRFRYLGPEPRRMHIYGAVFEVNAQPVLVKDITGCALLSRHADFVEVKDEPVPAPTPIPAPVVVQEVTTIEPLETRVTPAHDELEQLTEEELEAATRPNDFDDTADVEDTPKRRGRVPGSKNKPKAE
jgi:hypothetical protein